MRTRWTLPLALVAGFFCQGSLVGASPGVPDVDLEIELKDLPAGSMPSAGKATVTYRATIPIPGVTGRYNFGPMGSGFVYKSKEVHQSVPIKRESGRALASFAAPKRLLSPGGYRLSGVKFSYATGGDGGPLCLDVLVDDTPFDKSSRDLNSSMMRFFDPDPAGLASGAVYAVPCSDPSGQIVGAGTLVFNRVPAQGTKKVRMLIRHGPFAAVSLPSMHGKNPEGLLDRLAALGWEADSAQKETWHGALGNRLTLRALFLRAGTSVKLPWDAHLLGGGTRPSADMPQALEFVVLPAPQLEYDPLPVPYYEPISVADWIGLKGKAAPCAIAVRSFPDKTFEVSAEKGACSGAAILGAMYGAKDPFLQAGAMYVSVQP